MKKVWASLRWVLVAVLLVVGLALIFNEQIKTFVINNMTNTALNQKTTALTSSQKKKATFDFKSVSAVDAKTVSAAWGDTTGAIGKIAIPSVKLRLPIYYGLANSNLMKGAGTMKADQKMGKGNYALAGHHMASSKVLFSPLTKVKVGDLIYLTNDKKVYIYQVTKKTRVYKTQVQWIDDVPNKKLVTLVTCASATEGEVNRIIVRGKLVKVQSASKQNLKVFTSAAPNNG